MAPSVRLFNSGVHVRNLRSIYENSGECTTGKTQMDRKMICSRSFKENKMKLITSDEVQIVIKRSSTRTASPSNSRPVGI